MFRRRLFVVLDPFSRGYVSIFIQMNNIRMSQVPSKPRLHCCQKDATIIFFYFIFPFKDLMAANTAPSCPNLSDQFMEVTLVMIKRHKLLSGK